MWGQHDASMMAILALSVACHAPNSSAQMGSTHQTTAAHFTVPALTATVAAPQQRRRTGPRHSTCFVGVGGGGDPSSAGLRSTLTAASRSAYRRQCRMGLRSRDDGEDARERGEKRLERSKTMSRVQVCAGGYGEINGSQDTSSGSVDRVAIERGTGSGENFHESKAGDATEQEEFDSMWGRIAARARDADRLGDIDDPLDYVYAVMPDIQAKMRESIGREGIGTGYEDVQVGFYRDTNLKPMNWRDAMVSMRPGSGTKGLHLDPREYDYDDNNEDLPWTSEDKERNDNGQGRLGTRHSPRDEGMEGDGSSAGSGLDPSTTTQQSKIAARRALEEEYRRRASEKVRTRYGGPAPGEHGPWRWGQVEPGSPFHQKLEAEIASFPRRLPWRLRRYFHDKVVWVTGADGGLGERLAINLTVNGAKVILTGVDLRDLERVQRLCILAWMKAVDWDILTAFIEGLTRLDRAMVLPMDVEDTYIHEDAAKAAERMLGRPINMLFACPDEYEYDDEDEGVENDERGLGGIAQDLEAMERNLWAVVGLTKAVLPHMLDQQEGHIIVVGGEESVLAATEGASAANEVASKHALRGYFDSLRAEVARDNVRVTLVHPGEMASEDELDDNDGVSTGSTESLDPDHVARKVLVALARGRQEVFVEKRGVLGWIGIGKMKQRHVLGTLRGLLP